MNTTASAEKPTVLLTFDVEDWFQVENFKSSIPRSSWDRCELRVWKNTISILDILEKAPGAPRATFFILGWVAEKLPALVREITKRGHEVASHGDSHQLCHEMAPKAFLRDLVESRKRLEDITGRRVYGYRAPSFSISDQALALVYEAGYLYDSSYNSFGLHGRYGSITLFADNKDAEIYPLKQHFFEVPLSNLRMGKRVFPLGGGGYFRLFPFPLFKLGVKKVLKTQKAFVFYAHPWEFDPKQPRVHAAPLAFKFRHYVNLSRTGKKLEALIMGCSTANFTTIKGHIQAVAPWGRV